MFNTTLLIISRPRSFSLRHLFLIISKKHSGRPKSPVYPELFTQQVVLSNGATYSLRTSSPKPQAKLIKDTRNHPLWNPAMEHGLSDESGQLSRFQKRFGDAAEYDLEFVESDEKPLELTAKEAARLQRAMKKGKKK